MTYSFVCNHLNSLPAVLQEFVLNSCANEVSYRHNKPTTTLYLNLYKNVKTEEEISLVEILPKDTELFELIQSTEFVIYDDSYTELSNLNQNTLLLALSSYKVGPNNYRLECLDYLNFSNLFTELYLKNYLNYLQKEECQTLLSYAY